MYFGVETGIFVIVIKEDENFEFRSLIVDEESIPRKRGLYIAIPLINTILTLFFRAELEVFWSKNRDVCNQHYGQKF